MTSDERIYDRCRLAARDLLRGLETKDLSVIEQQLALVQAYLSDQQWHDQARRGGDALYRAEQLEALAGVTEEIERSLLALKRSADIEFERLLAAAPLLRHLTVLPASCRAINLPVC